MYGPETNAIKKTCENKKFQPLESRILGLHRIIVTAEHFIIQ